MEYESRLLQYFIELIFMSLEWLMKKVYRIHFYECSLNMRVDSWKNTHKTFIELTPELTPVEIFEFLIVKLRLSRVQKKLPLMKKRQNIFALHIKKITNKIMGGDGDRVVSFEHSCWHHDSQHNHLLSTRTNHSN